MFKLVIVLSLLIGGILARPQPMYAQTAPLTEWAPCYQVYLCPVGPIMPGRNYKHDLWLSYAGAIMRCDPTDGPYTEARGWCYGALLPWTLGQAMYGVTWGPQPPRPKITSVP